MTKEAFIKDILKDQESQYTEQEITRLFEISNIFFNVTFEKFLKNRKSIVT
jgi:hypothetical protein